MAIRQSFKVVTLFVGLVFIALMTQSRASSLQSSSVVKQGLQAIEKGQWETASRLMVRDPLGKSLYKWLYFKDERNKNVTYSGVAQFIRTNPNWPKTKSLRLRVEGLMHENIKPSEAIAWFNDYSPLTMRAFFIYVNALITTGQKDKAKTIIAQWWVEKPLSRKDQKKLYQSYRHYIDLPTHRKRLDNLIDDGHYNNARGVAGVLGPGYLELTDARIALAAKKPNVSAAIARVPKRLKNDPGLLYERARWRRRNNLNDGAIDILNKAPDMSKVSNPKDWWQERHIIIRRLIEKKNYRKAYDLAKTHKQTEGFSMAQAEFVAGWLALRHRGQPAHALDHFENLYNNVKTPISKARGAYWAGRAESALGETEKAKEWYNRAARFQTTFYGQTAGAQLGMQKALTFAAPPNLTSEDVSRFNADEMIRATRVLHSAGLQEEAGLFLRAFVNKEKTPKAYLFGAGLASDLKDYYAAVRISKEATKKGLFFTAQSFPVIAKDLKNVSVDWALVHALIRQESQFDPRAKSPVGARGLMQLMPATARETARKMGVRHTTAQLTANPAHNIMLGSEYLRKMLVRFGGSYPLAIASYNAGPNRVDKWLKIYGDPRLGQADWIDWIETIPIYETRNYVQRVLEGVYVYHFRLKDINQKTKQPMHVARVY